MFHKFQAANGQPVFMTGEEGNELAKAGYITANGDQKDPSNPLAVLVTLTEAGQAAFQASMGQQAAAPVAPAPVAPAAIPTAPVAPTVPVAPTHTGEAPVQSAAPNVQVPVDRDSDGAVDFKVSTGVAIPKVKRGGNLSGFTRKSKYPFDSLGEPTVDANGAMTAAASFHVPATPKNPEPWKKLASTVTAANRRSHVEAVPQVMETVTRKRLVKGADGEPALDGSGKQQYQEYTETRAKTVATKRFICRKVDETDAEGAGARVFRVPVDFKG